MEEIDRHNKEFGRELPLQIRCVLGYGKIEFVDDQLFGSILSDAERLISDSNFKEYQTNSGKNSVLFLTNLFYFKLGKEIPSDGEFRHLHSLKWTRAQVKDKHENIHIGYLLGDYVIEEETKKNLDSNKSCLEILKNYCKETIFQLESYNTWNTDNPDQLMLNGYVYDDIVHHYVSPQLIRHIEPRPELIEDGLKTLIELMSKKERCVACVIADSGVGKSFLMIRLLYELSKDSLKETEGHRHYPIFIPLGKFQEGPFSDYLLGFINEKYGMGMEKVNFEAWIEKGQIILLLDALDEIPSRDYRTLQEVIEKAQKVIITTRKNLINSIADLGIHNLLTATDLFSDSTRLYEILTFNKNLAREYFNRRGRATLYSRLESTNTNVEKLPTIALRLISEREACGYSIGSSLTEIYDVYVEDMTRYSCTKITSGLSNSTEIKKFFTHIAESCYKQNVTTFKENDIIFPSEVGSDKLKVLLQHPLLSKSRGEFYDEFKFHHPSFIPYYVSLFKSPLIGGLGS